MNERERAALTSFADAVAVAAATFATVTPTIKQALTVLTEAARLYAAACDAAGEDPVVSMLDGLDAAVADAQAAGVPSPRPDAADPAAGQPGVIPGPWRSPDMDAEREHWAERVGITPAYFAQFERPVEPRLPARHADELPPCADCGHRAWAHGDQSGFPADGEPCHAAGDYVVAGDAAECACQFGYRRPC